MNVDVAGAQAQALHDEGVDDPNSGGLLGVREQTFKVHIRVIILDDQLNGVGRIIRIKHRFQLTQALTGFTEQLSQALLELLRAHEHRLDLETNGERQFFNKRLVQGVRHGQDKTPPPNPKRQ